VNKITHTLKPHNRMMTRIPSIETYGDVIGLMTDHDTVTQHLDIALRKLTLVRLVDDTGSAHQRHPLTFTRTDQVISFTLQVTWPPKQA